MRRHLHVYRRVWRGWFWGPRAECGECRREEALENLVPASRELLEALRKPPVPR